MDCGKNEVLIAVMGQTGSGKTTFINKATQSDLGVGNGLKSCTSTIQTSPSFELDGRKITLIDTPGFDDTYMTDTQILRMIALFLSATYESGIKLAGVLYFHRISDNRMGGLATKNFQMFRNLCGEKSLKNVVIVTNMWGQVDTQVGLARERELVGDPAFFKPALDKGAQIQRHDNTAESAHNIIQQILKNHPIPLRIQEELVDEKKDLSATEAGAALSKELQDMTERYRKQIEELRAELEEALKAKDEEHRRELEVERQKLQAKMERAIQEARNMTPQYKADKERWEPERKREGGTVMAPRRKDTWQKEGDMALRPRTDMSSKVQDSGVLPQQSPGWIRRFLTVLADFIARICSRLGPFRAARVVVV